MFDKVGLYLGLQAMQTGFGMSSASAVYSYKLPFMTTYTMQLLTKAEAKVSSNPPVKHSFEDFSPFCNKGWPSS